MRYFQTLLILLLFVCNTLYAESAPSDSVEEKVNWKAIKSKKYQINYPSHWVLTEGDADGIAFTLYAPGPKSFGGYEENINLIVQDLSGRDLDLDAYTKLSECQVHTLVENSKLIQSQRTDTVADEYHQIVYTGDYGDQKLKWKMRFWVVKDQAYVLTYTATKENFGLYIEVADEIMDTFTLR